MLCVHRCAGVRCTQDMLVLTHQRAKVCLRMDQPLAALELYSSAAQQHPGDVGLLLAQARIQEAVGQHAQSLSLYQQVCSSCIQAPLVARLLELLAAGSLRLPCGCKPSAGSASYRLTVQHRLRKLQQPYPLPARSPLCGCWVHAGAGVGRQFSRGRRLPGGRTLLQ